jgi:puromycin-sensitive aminopeptidase
VRATVISLLGTLGGDEAIRAEARRRVEADELPGDLARALLKIVAETGTAVDFDLYLERYRAAASPQEQQRYQWALADFTDAGLMERAAAACFDEFRSQDAPLVLGLLTGQRTSGPVAWRYMVSRWDEALEKFPHSAHSRMGSGLATFVSDRAFASDVTAFHRSHPLAGEQRTIDQYLERLAVGLTFADAMRAQMPHA